MEKREIEIQVVIENVRPLVAFLKERGQFRGKKHQRDEYFSPSHRDFLAVRPVREWFRLRSTDGAYSVNYKYWHMDSTGKSLYCDEQESALGDGEAFRAMLTALDFRPLITVDKIREIWLYRDYEISIDRVKNLGDFVEIEYYGLDTQRNPEEIIQEMISFLQERGCGKITRNRAGYPFQFLFPDEVLREEH